MINIIDNHRCGHRCGYPRARSGAIAM